MNVKTSRILIALNFVFSAVLFTAINAFALSDGHATCNYCHDLHGGPGNNLLNQPNQSDHVLLVEVVCSNCHDAVDPPIATAPQVVSHNFDRGNDDWRYISCRECHDPHDNQNNAGGGTNLKMVGFKLDPADLTSGFAAAQIRRIDSANQSHTDTGTVTDVYFETATDFVDGSQVAPYDRICEVCHRDEDFASHSWGGNDVVGRDCQDCHAHSDGFDRW